MFAFDGLFDFNNDGRLDSLERAIQFQVLDGLSQGSTMGHMGAAGNYTYEDNDSVDVFADAGLDYDELEFMDPAERRGVLEEAGLNPDEFDF